MSLTAGDIQVWLESPVTRWVFNNLEKEMRKIELRLRKEKFISIADVSAAQAELQALEKWLVRPGQQLKQLLNQSAESTEETDD